MADSPLHLEILSGAQGFQLGQQTINVIAGNLNQHLSNAGDLTARLNPIPDASHTRDRKTSPPDSVCFPGTREKVITEITTWADEVDSAPQAVDALVLERLVYKPFQSAVNKSPAKGPFIIIIDGLDECEDKRGVEEFIDQMLDFFEEHPDIPLRVFIASRVEQHIRERLETKGVRLGNLDSHSAHKDIEKFLQASFQIAAQRDRVIRAYVRARGSWPTQLDMDKLIDHINGSFVLASTMLKFIVQPAAEEDPTTPMDRLPLTLEMNGLDGLYAQALARSQHLAHFREIISTIALLQEPLPIIGIADLLGIEAFEVIRILLNLQAVIHVPGTDEEGKVSLCHTSLRDFLTTESRSGSFFVPPLFHLYLSYFSFSSALEHSHELARAYGRDYFDSHWQSFARSGTCDFIQEIEQFKACQPLLADRMPYHTFLCSIFFHALLMMEPLLWNEDSYLLTECVKQLVLAVECPDHRIRLWLEGDLPHDAGDHQEYPFRLSERTHETLDHGLRRVSTAIHANFPELLGPRSTAIEEKFVFHSHRLSGIDIFKTLDWIVARARFKWEELKITPNPPLELSMSFDWTGLYPTFSFDAVSAVLDSDPESTSSDSDFELVHPSP
ncbi:hypothetical protein EST38_g12966 [Candolleomyces aberdarensis]|uniref:Nephrocystin 3-like N-terminal domain-containing protein n=1 Tax=Candolleomyces aberdarensis TaxID=2316362 RepID=A0A4Q2D132_9AGAR|nr:hypothetical protein EST38_g12966 [Candolleomyces aberdarensis]